MSAIEENWTTEEAEARRLIALKISECLAETGIGALAAMDATMVFIGATLASLAPTQEALDGAVKVCRECLGLASQHYFDCEPAEKLQ